MPTNKALERGCYYHIYHRGNNREPIFFEKKNYHFFLERYIKYIEPIAFTYAYCLMNNHVHFSIRTKTLSEQKAYFDTHNPEPKTPFKPLSPSQQFANLFNSYAKSINKIYGRSGSLFENRFGRDIVQSERYFYNLIIYIHRNPQTHGFVDDFRDWPWTSYDSILSNNTTRLSRTKVLDWFGSRQDFQLVHEQEADRDLIARIISEDV